MAISLWKIGVVICVLVSPLISQTRQQQYKTKEQCDQQARRAFDNGLEVNTLMISKGRRIPIKILVEDMDNESGVELAFAEVLNQLFPGRFDVRDDAETVLYASGTDLRKSQISVQTYHVSLYAYYMARVIVNNQPKPITGKFMFSQAGGDVRGDEEYRTRAFKEAAYEVVKEALKELDNSKNE